MAGLTRRAFLATTAAVAGSFALPNDLLARAAAAPLTPSTAPSTLQQTIRLSSTANLQYRNLVTAPGEPYNVRLDLLGREPAPARAASRRSLAYLGHFSDIHIIDAQSPGRLEPLIAVAASFIDASRPQDTMTVQVLAQMVAAMNALRISPLTGAPMTAALNTGDSADSRNSLELRWCIDMLDGEVVVPNSGKRGEYQGVQVWEEADYVYHPDNPNLNDFGAHGFPTLPGVLQSAVDQEVSSVGLAVPWYTVYGNHDTLFMGNIQVESALASWAINDRKSSLWPATVNLMANWWASNSSMFQQLVNTIRARNEFFASVHTVTANPERKIFDQAGFMQAHLQSPALPGPVGHGFTQNNVDTGQTWWKTDVTPWLRVFGLDTCNQVTGADGAVPQDQFDWLRSELAQAQSEKKLAIVCSHHNSFTLENVAEPAIGPTQNLVHSDEFVAMLLEYPSMVAWVNGHTHINTITAHSRPGGGGFWEITTASCVDYPQQQQVIEIVDNRDSTLSIFTTVVDHDSTAQWSQGDYSQAGLASLSRQLAANAWQFEPLPRQGSVLDRNCELLLPAPFELATITDAQLERERVIARGRLLAGDVTGQLP
ncbi:MAG: TIGR03767 family metallophosphoesterase [Candidatus Nanopelagicales bacterium]